MDYILNYNPSISPLYITLSIPVFIFSFFLKYRKSRKNAESSTFFALLLTYIFLVLSSTVFCRPKHSYYDFQLSLFWSYRQIAENHDMKLLSEDILNCILLLPAGILYPLSSGKSFFKTALFGLCISASIEVSQLLLKRGLFEFDDIFHNVLGVMVGYYIFKVTAKIIMKYR